MYQTVTSILLIATLTWGFVVDGNDDSAIYNQKIKTACYGSIHVQVVHQWYTETRKVWFVPRYSRDTLEIYPRNTMPDCVWDLGSFVIEYVTEEHVGEYKILAQEGGSTTPFTFLRLTVKECTDTRSVNYGDKVDIQVTVAPTLLMFYPANEHHFYPTNDTSKGIELWSSNKPSNSEVPCTGIIYYECHWFVKAETGLIWATLLVNKRGEIWYVRNLRPTQKDQGMYVIRREDGRLIHKFQIFVQVTEPTKHIKPVLDWYWYVIMVTLLIATNLLCCLRKCCNSKSSDDAEAPPVSNQIEEELMRRHPPNMMPDDSCPPSYEQIQHLAISHELMQRHPPNMMPDDSCPPSYEQIQHPAISNDHLNDEGPSYTMPSTPTFELKEADFLAPPQLRCSHL